MVSDQAALVICPNCAASDGVTLGSGLRLCFNCRHEWNPADVVVPAVVVHEDPPSLADDVLGPPPEVLAAREAQAQLDALIGTLVTLEGGQRATIVGFPDDDHVEVRINYSDGESTTYVADFNDITGALNPPATPVEIDDETALALASANATCAGLVLQAALECIHGEGANRQVDLPPTGWLPKTSKAWAVVEQGAAYAAAMLIYSFELPRDQVEAMIADFVGNVEQTERQVSE